MQVASIMSRLDIFNEFKNDYLEEGLSITYVLDRVQDWDMTFMNTISIIEDSNFKAEQPVIEGDFIWNCLSWKRPSDEDVKKAEKDYHVVTRDSQTREFKNPWVVELSELPKENADSYINGISKSMKEDQPSVLKEVHTISAAVELAKDATEYICKNESNPFIKQAVVCFSAYMICRNNKIKFSHISPMAEDYIKENFYNISKIVDYTRKVGQSLHITGRHGNYDD